MKINHRRLALTLCVWLLLGAVFNPASAASGVDSSLPQNTPGWGSATIVVLSSSYMPEDSPFACIIDQVAQGIGIREATAACDLSSFASSFNRPDMGGFLSFGGAGMGTTSGSISCTAAGTNPSLAAGVSSPSVEQKHAPPDPRGENAPREWDNYNDLAADAEKAWAKYVEALNKAANLAFGGASEEETKQALQEVIDAKKAADAAIKERNKYVPLVAESDDGGDGNVSTVLPLPGAEDACLETALFVAECNSNGWTSAECRRVKERMENCPDSTISLVNPDAEQGCGVANVDPNEVERVVVLVCEMFINPVPGEDPCITTEIETPVMRGYVPAYVGDDNLVEHICNDPRALTTGEGCAPSISLTSFTEINIQDIINEGQKHFGGPIIILPVPPPPEPFR
jgi:hypothetical protein